MTHRPYGAYAVALVLLLPRGKAAAFAGVQRALFEVLLGGAFAPNHIGMPIVPAGVKLDFLRPQVLMSRNITGGPLTGYLMGGLKYQIEHHHFPNMPRPSVKRDHALVRAHCATNAVAYTETGLFSAYRAIARYLRPVSFTAKDPFTCPLVAMYRGAAPPHQLAGTSREISPT